MSSKPKTECSSCQVRCLGPMAHLNQTSLAAFDHDKTVRVYQPGQIIFYEDNKPFGVYCLEKGKVKLTKYTSDGKSYITRILKAGNLLGHRAFLTHEAYAATAEVIEEATICFLDRDVFMNTLQQAPGFALQLMEQLGSDLRFAENQARDLAYKSVPERLAELLLNLKEDYGQVQSDGDVLLDILLSREELASLLGTTVETTVRTLSRFKQLKLIGQHEKRMLLKDLPRLAQYIACA